MQKIKRPLYEEMIKNKLSRLELKFLFYLAGRCNQYGEVPGIYYSNISKDLKCSVAKFYHLRDDLTKKGFIYWEKNDSSDIDITLLGNSFIEIVNGQEEIVYKNYIDININVFNDEKFFNCKAGSIQLAMEIIKNVAVKGAITESNLKSANKYEAERKRKIWYKPYNFYKNNAKTFKVYPKVIREYMEELNPWISVGHNIISNGEKHDVITVKKNALLKPDYITNKNSNKKKKKIYPERYIYLQHVMTCCRRNNKIEHDEKNLSDTADLIKQYIKIATEKGKNIYTLITKAILGAKDTVLNSFNVHRSLQGLIGN